MISYLSQQSYLMPENEYSDPFKGYVLFLPHKKFPRSRPHQDHSKGKDSSSFRTLPIHFTPQYSFPPDYAVRLATSLRRQEMCAVTARFP